MPNNFANVFRILRNTVPRVGHSCELLPDGFYLHFLHLRKRDFFFDDQLIHLMTEMISPVLRHGSHLESGIDTRDKIKSGYNEFRDTLKSGKEIRDKMKPGIECMKSGIQ